MPAQQSLRQRNNLLRAFAQRRNHNIDDIEPVIKIFAKCALFDAPAQIAVGCGHHTDVYLDDAAAAERLHFAILQDLEKLGLKANIHVADLVQQNGSALGEFKLARLVDGGPVKAPFSYPNNSLSISSEGRAAQFNLRNGLFAREE